MKLHYS